MNKTDLIIDDMIKDMHFERRKGVTKQTKSIVAQLKTDLEYPIAELNKLHLRLWHSFDKSDYHSLTLDEAKGLLKKIREDIDRIITEDF